MTLLSISLVIGGFFLGSPSRSRSLDKDPPPRSGARAAASGAGELACDRRGGRGVEGDVSEATSGGIGKAGAPLLPRNLHMTSAPPDFWKKRVESENASVREPRLTRRVGAWVSKREMRLGMAWGSAPACVLFGSVVFSAREAQLRESGFRCICSVIHGFVGAVPAVA